MASPRETDDARLRTIGEAGTAHILFPEFAAKLAGLQAKLTAVDRISALLGEGDTNGEGEQLRKAYTALSGLFGDAFAIIGVLWFEVDCATAAGGVSEEHRDGLSERSRQAIAEKIAPLVAKRALLDDKDVAAEVAGLLRNARTLEHAHGKAALVTLGVMLQGYIDCRMGRQTTDAKAWKVLYGTVDRWLDKVFDGVQGYHITLSNGKRRTFVTRAEKSTTARINVVGGVGSGEPRWALEPMDAKAAALDEGCKYLCI